jgi:hypothetical protein
VAVIVPPSRLTMPPLVALTLKLMFVAVAREA